MEYAIIVIFYDLGKGNGTVSGSGKQIMGSGWNCNRTLSAAWSTYITNERGLLGYSFVIRAACRLLIAGELRCDLVDQLG